jgi:hypothetical protein
VKRMLNIALVIGALLGIFGSQVALARGPQALQAESAAVSMSPDCMAAMQDQQPQPVEKPCKGMTLACIAAMGCALPLTLPAGAAALAGDVVGKPIHYMQQDGPLAGRSIGPEPDPPTFLT